MFSRLSLFSVLVLFSFKMTAAEPIQSAQNSALNALVKQLNQIQSISGSFVQYAIDQRGTTIQESRGSFKAMRPGFFYWRTNAPLEQEIFSDGETVTVYDPDLEQATIQPADSQTDNTPAVLFSGDTDKIKALYSVENGALAGGENQYMLLPVAKESVFERLLITFQGLHLKEMRLKDSLGQESIINFVQTEINPDLDARDFRAVLPNGTDVIEEVPIPSVSN